VNGAFEGFYEAGSLFGRVTIGNTIHDVVVSDQGVAVDDTLYWSRRGTIRSS
jgi:hypothetical protein